MYTELPNGLIQKDDDLSIIPNDERNLDRVRYRQWVAEGNKPTPLVIDEDERASVEYEEKKSNELLKEVRFRSPNGLFIEALEIIVGELVARGSIETQRFQRLVNRLKAVNDRLPRPKGK